MTDKAGYYVTVSDDRALARLHIEINDEDSGHIEMEGPELDALIDQLGKARSRLVEQVPVELEPNARLNETVGPAYRIDNVRSRGRDGISLSVRHQSYGWLTFHFERGDSLVFADQVRRAATSLGQAY